MSHPNYGNAPPPPGFNVYQGNSSNAPYPPPSAGFNVYDGKPSRAPNYSNGPNPDFGGTNDFAFSNKTIRSGFIRKVYLIVMCQLLITLGFITWFHFSDGTRKWVVKNESSWLAFFIISMIGTIVLTIIMACFTSIRRTTPWNFIFLFTFTLMESFLVASITVLRTKKPETVLGAIAITAIICLGLTIFAFQTKWDFTGCGPFLFILSLALLLFGIAAMIIKDSKVSLIYGFVGVVIFSFYLVYDTQLMIGGNHKYSISPEEYIFAALSIYTDVIQIFLFILSLFRDS